jgi:hypothetical protein
VCDVFDQSNCKQVDDLWHGELQEVNK